MVLKTKELQDVCRLILDAVDSSAAGVVAETLELKASGRELRLSVTNREYYVAASLPLADDVEMDATVSADLFLGLISKVTTGDVELTASGRSLSVQANGSYSLPLIYEGDRMVSVPEIPLGEATTSFDVPTDVFRKLTKYNCKELLKSGLRQPIQKMFYIDEKGAITFTSGACVTSFALEKPIRLVMNEKTVRLLKLFKGKSATLSLGMSATPSGRPQAKVRFEDGSVTLTAILPADDPRMGVVPVEAIRAKATARSEYSASVDKDALLAAMKRLSLFVKKDIDAPVTYLEFSADEVKAYDPRKANCEPMPLAETINNMPDEGYSCSFVTKDLELTLSSCDERYVTLGFGDGKTMIVSRPGVCNIVPECRQR